MPFVSPQIQPEPSGSSPFSLMRSRRRKYPLPEEVELWGYSAAGQETQLTLTEHIAGPWTFRVALPPTRA